MALVGPQKCTVSPEGPARHLDASRQKLTPHCLAAIFDSQLPSPKLSHKMPPKLPLPHNRGHFFLFQSCPRGEGNCAAIERQKLSRGNFCLAASRCLSGPSGSRVKRQFDEWMAPVSRIYRDIRGGGSANYIFKGAGIFPRSKLPQSVFQKHFV